MKAFVSKEFDCTLWKDIFSKNTLQTLGIKQEPTEKKQKQIFLEQKNNVKNVLVEHVANKLVVKGKQYSTYVSQSCPHYEECIRFPVHVDDYADISQKIPFSLIHGYLEHLGIMH